MCSPFSVTYGAIEMTAIISSSNSFVCILGVLLFIYLFIRGGGGVGYTLSLTGCHDPVRNSRNKK